MTKVYCICLKNSDRIEYMFISKENAQAECLRMNKRSIENYYHVVEWSLSDA